MHVGLSMIVSLPRFTPCFVIAFPLCFGCAPRREVDGSDKVNQNSSEALLTIIADKDLSSVELEHTLTTLQRMKVSERPQSWIKIIQDPAYSNYHRKRCLAVFFPRHITAGTS